MKNEETPEVALASLRSITGALYRHGPDNSQEYLSMATRLETGIWIGVKDRGIFPGRVYGNFCGTEVVVDLYLHQVAEDGEVIELPVQWAMRSLMSPLVVLGIPGDRGDAPEIASSAELAWPQYQVIYRPVIQGNERYDTYSKRADTPFLAQVSAKKGSIYDPPMLQHYRNGADSAANQRSICISADMNYPADIYVGGPVVDDFGRLAGVIIGTDPGPERGHVGMYVPADLIPSSVEHAYAALEALKRGDRYSTGIELVQFWNSEPELPELYSDRRATHQRDKMLKAVLPRSAWETILRQLEANGSESEDDQAAVQTLKDILED